MIGEPSRIEIEIARDDAGLAARVPEWDALTEQAVEPNVFFESGAVRAALRHLAVPGPLCGVFVYRETGPGRRLIAFAPFLRSVKGPRGVIPYYRLFTHLHCYLSTPLIHREHVDEALDALVAWMDGGPDGVHLFGLYKMTGDGVIARRLAERMAARRLPHFGEASHDRAFLCLDADPTGYAAQAIPAKKRKDLARQRRRLSEMGKLDVTEAEGEADASAWVERFLILEARGWKGRTGTAFNRTPAGRRFFIEFIDYFRRRGRAMLLALRLDDRDVAMKCNLLAPDGIGAFAFKIAHDEGFAPYSPGVLLELDNLERLHAGGRRIAWMDSCADPDHPMIDHLWRERRRIVFLLCGGRGLLGRALLATFRWRNRRARGKGLTWPAGA